MFIASVMSRVAELGRTDQVVHVVLWLGASFAAGMMFAAFMRGC